MSAASIIDELTDDLEMQRHDNDNLRRAYVDAVDDLKDMECKLDVSKRCTRLAKEELQEMKSMYLETKAANEALKRDYADLQEELDALSRDYKHIRARYLDLEDRDFKRQRR